MKKYKYFLLIITFFLSNGFVMNVKANPFIPKIVGPDLSNEDSEYIPPLKRWGIFHYDFIGTVLSSHQKLALIKTPDGERYRLNIGMGLGNGDEIIVNILIDRLVLKSNKETKILVLKNHEF